MEMRKDYTSREHGMLGRRLRFIKKEISCIRKTVDDEPLKMITAVINDYLAKLKRASYRDYGLQKTKWWYD